jgi:predicted transcriptional regulator
MAPAARAMAPESQRQTGQVMVQWNETAGMAAHRMRVGGVDSLAVVADGRPIGRITRRDIERCENQGNWLEAVMVRDLVGEPRDTCN